MRDPDCIFCKIVPGELPATIIGEDERTASFMDINLINSCGRAAWQTVFDFHVHVIPRYDDDPLRLPWTPAEGDPDEIAAAASALG